MRTNDRKVRLAGMDAVVKTLTDQGWALDDDILSDDIDGEVTKIEVQKDEERMLVTVKSSYYPLDPGFPSPEERERLRTMADSKGCRLYLARVWLNKDLSPKDKKVMWTNI